MEKFYKWLIVFGIVLHLCLSVVTYHPDLRAFVLAGSFIQKGEVFTFYDHVSKLPQGDIVKKIYGDDIFIYPPLAYLIPAVFYLPLSPFLTESTKILLTNDSSMSQMGIFLPLIFYKLPFLIFSLLTFIFLPRLFSKKTDGQLAQLIWLFSPITFHVSSGIGQADTILTFFLLLSLIAIKSKKYKLSGIFVALSALIKPFGLALLPLIAIKIYRKDGFKKAIFSIVPGIITWIIFVAPYVTSPAFKMYALLASLAGKSTYAGIAISGGTSIPYLYIFYLIIALYLYEGKIGLIKSFGLTILSTLAFNHFHPQWFLWFLPWLIYYSVSTKKYYLIFVSLLCWTLIWISFDPSQTLGMFLSLKNIYTPTTLNPLQDSTIVLFARAGLVATLISYLR